MPQEPSNKTSCPTGCRCSKGLPDDQGSHDGLAGWRLSVAAVFGFLLPLLLGIVGAAVSPSDYAVLGGAAGIGVGVAVAWVTSRRFERVHRPEGGRA